MVAVVRCFGRPHAALCPLFHGIMSTVTRHSGRNFAASFIKKSAYIQSIYAHIAIYIRAYRIFTCAYHNLYMRISAKNNMRSFVVNTVISTISFPTSFMKVRSTFSLLALIVMAFLLASCGPDRHHGRVEGTIEGVNQAKMLVYAPIETGGDAGRMDTILVKRGDFSYEREIEGPVILRMLYPNFSQTSFVMMPGKTVKLKGDGNRLKEITVDGNEDNLLLTEFRQRLLKLRDTEIERVAATFVRSHPASLAAVAVFYDVFAEKEVIVPNPTESLLATLRKAQPENDMLEHLEAYLKPLMATAPGSRLPAFTVTDIDGKKITQADLKGKPSLIVFCSQWQGSFYQVGRKAEAIRQQFPESRLNMLFFVLDERESSLRKRLKTSPLPGRVVCDGKGMSSPVIRKLGMRYIGDCVLCDKDGTIIARDIRYNDWEEEVPSFLKD